jgi:hypothetical protein
MGYFVKPCPRCKTLNHPSMTFCAKCGSDLPDVKVESDTRPMAPPAYAVTAARAETGSPTLSGQNLGNAPDKPVECAIVDVSIPFFSMVSLLVKLAVAAIPALIILFVLAVFGVAVLLSMGIGSRPF